VFTDADGSYGPEQLEKVVAALETAPVAIGARLDPQAAGGSPLLRRLASPVFNRAMRLLLGLPYADTQCGLKGFRRDAAQALFSRARGDGVAFDAGARRGRGAAGRGWRGSPSPPRPCWSPPGSASRSWRCRWWPRTARAARSAWAGTRCGCWPTSGRGRGGRAPGASAD